MRLAVARFEERLLDAALSALGVCDAVARALGIVLLALALVLIGGFAFTYFETLLPLLGVLPFTAAWWAVTTPGLWILFNILQNLCVSVLRNPGSPSKPAAGAPQPPPRGDDSDSGSDDDDDGGGGSGGAFGAVVGGGATAPQPPHLRWCHRCQAPKPPRTHHCSVCRACVLKMDHHCPWLNNCVGWGNHAHFLRLLFYLVVGCAFIACVSARPFFASLALGDTLPASAGFGTRLASRRTRLQLSFVMSLTVGAAVAGLFAWNASLALRNVTGIEVFTTRRGGGGGSATRGAVRGRAPGNAYDLGWRRNWEEVFGTSSLWRWALPTLALPPGDGEAFPTRAAPRRGGHGCVTPSAIGADAAAAAVGARDARRRAAPAGGRPGSGAPAGATTAPAASFGGAEP